jgi:uncharacterized protein (DUF2336 family)
MAELNLIQELELAVSHGEGDRRAAALFYTTDLLISGRYKDDDVWMFGEVIGQLASEIETAARAELAARIAPCAHAPSNVIDRFARDDSIEVARPVLRHSERISPDTLLHIARTKSQNHLLAISQRSSLNEDLTDALLARGGREVVHAMAKNSGARFSESGFWKLVRRSENDVVLTLEVGGRTDIPRHHFQKLIAKASDEVKSKLAAINPNAVDEICTVVAGVTGSIHERFGPATRSYYAAKRQVGEMHRIGQLTEETLCEFARARKFEEVTVALTLLCDLPVNVAERALHDEKGEMVLILAKAAKLSWATAKLLLLMEGNGISRHDLDEAMKNYALLNVTTARQVIQFYRSRLESVGAGGGHHARS